MHLFEPRWVDMVDVARSQFGGVVCFVYFGTASGEVVKVATVAEITACDNLGAAGRMVVARGVSRARLRGLSRQVVSADEWGFALVEEIPELRAGDLETSSEGGGAGAPEAAAELVRQTKELDLSEPSSAKDADAGPAEEEPPADEGEAEDGPRLWTHERVSSAEEFGALSSEESWLERRSSVQETLRGVPVRHDCDLQAAEQSVAAAAEGAVVDLYTAMGAASLEDRLRLFVDDDAGVQDRLKELSAQLNERQGMARARRALANVFSDDLKGEANGASSS